MKMDAYSYIKDMMSQGKTEQDIRNEVTAMIAQAKKDLTPKTPIKDAALQATRLKAAKDYLMNTDNYISENNLTQVLCAYLCQRDVTPDFFCDDYQEFYVMVRDVIKESVDTFKKMAKLGEQVKAGASQTELLKTIAGEMKDIFPDLSALFAGFKS